MEGSQDPKGSASRRRPTPRRVALELLVAEAAAARADFRVARLGLELELERGTGLRGRIRRQHSRLSRLLDVLVVLAEQERAA